MSYEIGTFETAVVTVSGRTGEADADGICCVVFFWVSSLYDENGDDTKSVTSSRCNDEGDDTVPVWKRAIKQRNTTTTMAMNAHRLGTGISGLMNDG